MNGVFELELIYNNKNCSLSVIMATHPRISSCDNAQLLVEMEAFLESKHNPSVIVERVQEENKIEKEVLNFVFWGRVKNEKQKKFFSTF